MSDNFTAVEILIKRMETNPGEFLRGGRLGYVADAIYEAALSPKLESERLWFFKDAEKIKLIAAYREYCRMQFQAELLAKLLTEDVVSATHNVNYKPTKLIAPADMVGEAMNLLRTSISSNRG